ncbi:MAG: hypothetical protein HY903_19190 [Deltaproteobacteria bacterium]|nr:hypothetical protein [Deltaproteobacteria bacterium]
MSVTRLRDLLVTAGRSTAVSRDPEWIKDVEAALAAADLTPGSAADLLDHDQLEILRSIGKTSLSGAAAARIEALFGRAAAYPATEAEPTTVVTLAASSIQILDNGALRTPDSTGRDPAVEAAGALAMRQLENAANPFAGVTDARLLRRVMAWHERLFDDVANAKRLAAETPYTRTHARAALLATLRLAALQLIELEGPPAAALLGSWLAATVKREPNPALCRFEIERLLRSPSLAATRPVRELERQAFAAAPPYEAWRKDGVLRVMAYCDDKGAPWAAQVQIFSRDLKMDIAAGSPTDPSRPITFVKDVRDAGGGFSRLEIILAPRPDIYEPPNLFEHLGNDGVDVILYSGHASYGGRVEAALRQGVTGTGEGTLIAMLQCSGVTSLESISRAFPAAQVFSTIDTSRASSDDVATVRLFEGLAAGHDWDAIMREMRWRAERPDASGYEPLYFAPNTRVVVERRMDLDADGVNDHDDPVYLEPTRELQTRAASGFNAVANKLPLYALDATAVSGAVADVALTLRYNQFDVSPKTPGTNRALAVDRDLLVNGGFFVPEPGEVRAFRFEPVEKDGRLRLVVRQNANLAHAQAEEVKNFLAFELGRLLAEWSGRAAADATAMGMAFYLQSLYHHKSEWEAYALLDAEAVEHRMFLARYGLPPLPLRTLLRSLEGDHAALSAFNRRAFLDRMRAWAGGETGQARPVGRSLATPTPPFSMRAANRPLSLDLTPARMQALVDSLPEVAGHRLLTMSPAYEQSDYPYTLQLLGPDGRRRLLLVAIDRKRGEVREVHDLADLADLRQLAVEAMATQAETWAPSIWTGPRALSTGLEVLGRFERALLSGTPLATAVDALGRDVTATGGDATALYKLFGHGGQLLYDAFPDAEAQVVAEYLWQNYGP